MTHGSESLLILERGFDIYDIEFEKSQEYFKKTFIHFQNCSFCGEGGVKF